MFLASTLVAVSAFIGSAYAHARLETPAGYGRIQGMDPFLNRSPLEANAQFCKGLQAAGGASSATWEAGSQQTFTLEADMAAHNGGSMQASLSFDGGKTFKVVKSYISGFPRNLGENAPAPDQSYTFTVPADAKAGEAIFSWSWSNNTGNREWYQDCAPVTITGAGTSTLDGLPDIFVANLQALNPGCTNPPDFDVDYPNPGADIERGTTSKGGATAPTGNCGAVVGGGAGSPPPDAPPAAPPAAPPTAPPAAPPAPPVDGGVAAGGGTTHTVVAGDFCDSIAAAAGITVADLIAKNPTVDASCTNLQPGQILNLRKRSRVMRNIY